MPVTDIERISASLAYFRSYRGRLVILYSSCDVIITSSSCKDPGPEASQSGLPVIGSVDADGNWLYMPEICQRHRAACLCRLSSPRDPWVSPGVDIITTEN